MDVMQTERRSTRFVVTTAETHAQFDSLNHHMILIPGAENNALMNSIQPEVRTRRALPSFLSTHRRSLISLGFLLMLGLSLLGRNSLADGPLQHLIQDLTLFSQSQPATQNVSLAPRSPVPANASLQLARISQLDPNQYGTPAEYQTWAYSACSTASMTEVFDSYGYHFHITDVLRVESQIGAITPDLGLVDPSGIASTAAKFGFKTQWGNDGSLDQVISIANSGKPVIVGFPPDRYDGGHILVVTGGNSDTVFLADTSLWNRHALSRAQFLQWWGGFYAVVTPN